MTNDDIHVDRIKRLEDHISGFWPGSEKEYFTWELGPIMDAVPRFRVCRVAPAADDQPWVYASLGACTVDPGEAGGLHEFFLIAPRENPRHVETLAMFVHYYAAKRGRLAPGSVIDCGRPWLGSSHCTHLLVSLPYPYGPDLEWCRAGGRRHEDIRLLWLLPVTRSEAEFARAEGVEALEALLDEHAIDAVDPDRDAVVP